MNEKQKIFEKNKDKNTETKNQLNKLKNKVEITSKTKIDLKKLKESKEKEKKNNNIIIFNGKKFDLTNYYKNVLNVAFKIIKNNGYNIDLKFLKNISLIENMGGNGDNKEIEATFKKFTQDNYKDLINNKSNKGAHGIFQVMPKTQEGIEKKYGIQKMIKKEKNNLIKNFSYKEIDFEILENTLYSAFTIIELQKNYKITSKKDLAGAYNAGPNGYRKGKKIGKLPNETKKYLKKYQAISKIIK